MQNINVMLSFKTRPKNLDNAGPFCVWLLDYFHACLPRKCICVVNILCDNVMQIQKYEKYDKNGLGILYKELDRVNGACRANGAREANGARGPCFLDPQTHPRSTFFAKCIAPVVCDHPSHVQFMGC